MSDLDANTMINDLTAAGHTRSKIRSLAPYLNAIEQCVLAGFRHAEIHAWLVEAGVKIEYGYYRNALSRLRKAANRSDQKKLLKANTVLFSGAFVGEKQLAANMIAKRGGSGRALDWDPLKPLNPFEIGDNDEQN